MIAVLFLRWIYGFFDFTVTGKFPERFLNLAAKKGIRLWNTAGSKNSVTASANISDTDMIQRLAKKSGCTVAISKHHGLPYFCRKYKSRSGLLAGAVIGSVFCVYMSGFIWNVTVNVPDDLNEYEIRRELAETGLYEGVPYKYDDISMTERQIKILDQRISWISINVAGTNAVVEISSKKDNSQRTAPDVQKPESLVNMISTSDATVTKVEPMGGKPLVKVGDGVHKGQLLISGVIPYTDGSSAISDSEGKVFAKTYKKVCFSVPKKKNTVIADTDHTCYKTAVSFFGIRIPFSLSGEPLSSSYKVLKESKLTLLQNDIPIYVTNETIVPYTVCPETVSESKAKDELKKKYELYRMFLLSKQDVSVLDEKISFIDNNDKYTLTAIITTEENICEKRTVEVRRE